jgi:hypothetical protein
MAVDVTGSGEDDRVFLRRGCALAGALLSWPAISRLPRRAAYPSRVAGDHYIQAALMGRWGEPPARSARERAIAVRMKQPAKTFQTTPENVGKETSLYPAWLEKFWHVYEGDFIRVAGDLDAGALRQGDEAYLLLHVSALKPRKSSFLDDLNEHQASSNLPLFTETDLPIERVKAVLRTLPYAETWRWRVLLPPQGERFIISDRGLCEFGDLDLRTGKEWPSHGVFFPLGPALGVLGFRHEPTLHRRVFRPLDFSERLTLNRGYTAQLDQDAAPAVPCQHAGSCRQPGNHRCQVIDLAVDGRQAWRRGAAA